MSVALISFEVKDMRLARHQDPEVRRRHRRHWVAEVGAQNGRIQRRFLRPLRDYMHASVDRQRHIGEWYVLYPGRYYDVCEPAGRRWSRRYYCTVRDGQVIEVPEAEVLREAHLTEDSRKAPPEHGGKRYLGIDVLRAAKQRIAWAFDTFKRVYVSFSGGKDSSVMLHLVMDEAIRRGRKVGVLFIDLEAQYQLTIEHVQAMYDLYADHIEPYWVALPISLRNAVSQYEPKWICWEPGVDWVRQPPKMAITDPDYFPFFRPGMEFEEFTPAFGEWYARGEPTACFVGIRTQESLNRWRTIASETKRRFEDRVYTTWIGAGVFNVYPIYDWKTEDIWIYNARCQKPYNRLYDRFYQAGLTIHQMRICQPYGDDQRKGLWLFHVIEPETWSRIVARVNGANMGATYARESGNILGNLKIAKPEGHAWKSFAHLLLASLPPQTQEHYKNKIAVFLRWWAEHGYPDGIPDCADPQEEARKAVPSWRRICKVLLRNDYWCKGLSFSQTKSEAYIRYLKTMKKKRQEWGIFVS